jgi:hypothetical protein
MARIRLAASFGGPLAAQSGRDELDIGFLKESGSAGVPAFPGAQSGPGVAVIEAMTSANLANLANLRD